MQLVLDSNEYIFVFGADPRADSRGVLEFIASSFPRHGFRICETVISEVRRHLAPDDFRRFILYIQQFSGMDHDFMVPAELFAKYEEFLKRGDAFIAAYAEWVGADVLISENRRHFHAHRALFPFKVRTAEQFLKEVR